MRAALLAIAATAAACGPAPRVGERVAGAGVLQPTLSSLQVNVFTPTCATASCHSGSPPANAPLSLDPGRSYGSLVGQPSLQAPMNLVESGDPAASYLVHKLRGTAGSVGGVSTRMPLGAAPLDEATLEAVETWIANGANDD